MPENSIPKVDPIQLKIDEMTRAGLHIDWETLYAEGKLEEGTHSSKQESSFDRSGSSCKYQARTATQDLYGT